MKTPTLSFKNGRPIGIIKGGKHENKLLYINDPDIHKNKKGRPKKEDVEKKVVPLDKMTLLDDIFFKNVRGRMKLIELEKLKRAIAIQHEPLDPKLNEMYKQANELLDKKINKELILHDGEIVPVPRVDSRECLYISGPSESGKSTYVGQYAKQWKKIFPKKDIVVFSRVDDDEPIDKLNPLRIRLDQSLVENPVQPSELQDCLVIFDDTDTIRDDKLRKEIIKLKDDLLQIGRHTNTYVIITSHQICSYKETRHVLNECTSITVFPKGSIKAINYCFKTYLGMDRKQISRVKKLPSRWVTVHTRYPQTIMYAKGAYLL